MSRWLVNSWVSINVSYAHLEKRMFLFFCGNLFSKGTGTGKKTKSLHIPQNMYMFSFLRKV